MRVAPWSHLPFYSTADPLRSFHYHDAISYLWPNESRLMPVFDLPLLSRHLSLGVSPHWIHSFLIQWKPTPSTMLLNSENKKLPLTSPLICPAFLSQHQIRVSPSEIFLKYFPNSDIIIYVIVCHALWLQSCPSIQFSTMKREELNISLWACPTFALDPSIDSNCMCNIVWRFMSVLPFTPRPVSVFLPHICVLRAIAQFLKHNSGRWYK